jgi:hypothetical protein
MTGFRKEWEHARFTTVQSLITARISLCRPTFYHFHSEAASNQVTWLYNEKGKGSVDFIRVLTSTVELRDVPCTISTMESFLLQ